MTDHWIMEFQCFDWLRDDGMAVIIPRYTGYSGHQIRSSSFSCKIKTAQSSNISCLFDF